MSEQERPELLMKMDRHNEMRKVVWFVKTVFRAVLDGRSVVGFHSLAALVGFFRCSVVQRLMRSFFVVEGEVEIQPFSNVVDVL